MCEIFIPSDGLLLLCCTAVAIADLLPCCCLLAVQYRVSLRVTILCTSYDPLVLRLSAISPRDFLIKHICRFAVLYVYDSASCLLSCFNLRASGLVL